jgi:hypothetical protein
VSCDCARRSAAGARAQADNLLAAFDSVAGVVEAKYSLACTNFPHAAQARLIRWSHTAPTSSALAC